MQEKNYVMGLWKFSDKISKEELGKVAEKWAAEDPNYLQLYLRKVSKNQMGIGFTYKLDDTKDGKKAHEEYFDKTSDFLKRSFGNDSAGWDMGSPVWIVK